MNNSRVNATRAWVLALASVASFMISLDLQVVSTALPTIHRSLGASIEQLEWTVNAYVLSFAVLLMTGTALGDRFGRRETRPGIHSRCPLRTLCTEERWTVPPRPQSPPLLASLR